MTRYLLYGVLGLTLSLGIAYAMALQYGLNPFDSALTLYWVVIVLVGLYVTLRIAMILEKRRSGQARKGDDASRSGGRRATAKPKDGLDARMEARRERVRRAQEKAAEQKGGNT